MCKWESGSVRAYDRSGRRDDCDVSTVVVRVTGGRESELLGGEHKAGIFLQESAYEAVVFLGLYAASAVADAAGGAEKVGASVEQIGLGTDDAVYVIFSQPIARFDSAGEDACVGAGHVQKDGVEGLLSSELFNLVMIDDDDKFGEAEAVDILCHFPESS